MQQQWGEGPNHYRGADHGTHSVPSRIWVNVAGGYQHPEVFPGPLHYQHRPMAQRYEPLTTTQPSQWSSQSPSPAYFQVKHQVQYNQVGSPSANYLVSPNSSRSNSLHHLQQQQVDSGFPLCVELRTPRYEQRLCATPGLVDARGVVTVEPNIPCVSHHQDNIPPWEQQQDDPTSSRVVVRSIAASWDPSTTGIKAPAEELEKRKELDDKSSSCVSIDEKNEPSDMVNDAKLLLEAACQAANEARAITPDSSPTTGGKRPTALQHIKLAPALLSEMVASSDVVSMKLYGTVADSLLASVSFC